MKKAYRRVLLGSIAVMVCLYSLLPIYWCLRTSLLAKADLLKSPPSWLPQPHTYANYRQLLGLSDSGNMLYHQFAAAFNNTLVVSFLATLFVCVISVLAGYVFARYRFRGSNVLFWFLLAVAIITFLSCWSQYAIPLVFASSRAQPLTVFLSTMVGKTSIHYGLMAAGGMLSIIPPLLVVFSLNKYLVGGLMKGFSK